MPWSKSMVNARSYYNDVHLLKDYYQGMKYQFYAPCFTLATIKKGKLNDDSIPYFIYDFYDV